MQGARGLPNSAVPILHPRLRPRRPLRERRERFLLLFLPPEQLPDLLRRRLVSKTSPPDLMGVVFSSVSSMFSIEFIFDLNLETK